MVTVVMQEKKYVNTDEQCSEQRCCLSTDYDFFSESVLYLDAKI